MDNERLDALFAEAVTVPPAERPRWLDTHCDGDVELRRELERLLAADAIANGVLEHASELLAAAMTDTAAIPQRFGVWRVIGALGAGGMGEVWLAERADGEFTQRAAIKQVAWPTPGLLHRFRRERQILAGLEHPGIARLIDGGVDDDGCPWLAMEYVEGVPIAQWVRARALNPRATVELMLRICDAVQFAHRNLVVHSDIKPSNILVSGDGEPKLLDFGIAKVLAQNGDTGERTRTLVQMLTPDYAAPELLAGGAITTSADVYALGVLLYELLAGQKPYRLAALGEGARRGLADIIVKPPSASVNNPRVGARARRRALRGDLDRVVLTAMAHAPAHRYASAEALAADLRNWLVGRALAVRGQGRRYRAQKFIARHRFGFAATLLAFAILLASTIYSLREAELAHTQAARANAVRDFIVGVFEQTDPDTRQGKPITARELLDTGERQLASTPGSPSFHTEMRGLLGYLHWQVGDYARGESLMRDAADHAAAATPPEVRAQNLLYLAQGELEKNLFPSARAHAAEARKLALQAGDAGTLIASQARITGANALALEGDAETAERIVRNALMEDTAAFGARSDRVAEDLGILAMTSQAQSRHQDTIGYVKQAIAISIALHGHTSSQVMGNLQTLAAAELDAGDLPTADRDMAEAADIAGKIYGPTHASTLSMRANLYVIRANNEQYAEALAGHLDLIRLTQPFANTRPEQLAYDWYGVATDYLGLGRYEEAAQAARRSLAYMSNPDPDYYIRTMARSALAEAMLMLGNLDAAEAGYAEVVHGEPGNTRDPDSWSLDLARLGNVYRLQHRYTEAVATTGKALAALPPGTGPTARRASIQRMAALAQLDAGSLAAAESLTAQATRTAAIALKGRPLALSAFQYTGARVALADRRPTDAETLLRLALSARKALPTDDPRKLEVQVGLIRALDMQGKRSGEAQVLRAQVEPVLATSPSPWFADLRNSLDTH